METKRECYQNTMDNAVCGNSIDIKIKDNEAAELRADVYVGTPQEGTCRVVRLWGQIKDYNQRPVPYALLKLVKVVCTQNGTKYQGIAHTISDCNGFYQFDLCYCDGKECYKILVSKACTGPEQVLDIEQDNCYGYEDGQSGYSRDDEYGSSASGYSRDDEYGSSASAYSSAYRSSKSNVSEATYSCNACNARPVGGQTYQGKY